MVTTISGSNQVENQVASVQVNSEIQTNESHSYLISENEFRTWAKEQGLTFTENKILNFFMCKMGVGPHGIKVEGNKKLSLNPHDVHNWRIDNQHNVLPSEKETGKIEVNLKADEHKSVTKAVIEQFKSQALYKKAFPETELTVEYFDKPVGLSENELKDLAAGLSKGKFAVTIDSSILVKDGLTRREFIKSLNILAEQPNEPAYITRMRDTKAAEVNAQKAGFLSGFLGGVRQAFVGTQSVEAPKNSVDETVEQKVETV